MRVLAVPQIADLVERERYPRRQHIVGLAAFERRALERDVAQREGDGGIVRRGVRDRLAGEIETELEARRPIEGVEQPAVVSWVDDDKHMPEILGGRAY